MRRRAAAILSDWGWTKGELSVVLTDDREVRELNHRWRGLDRTTDVLSFPQDGGPPIIGDVVISIEAAQRQRGRAGLERELTFLLVHGFLHLAGFDHKKAKERQEMRKMERRLMRAARAKRRK